MDLWYLGKRSASVTRFGNKSPLKFIKRRMGMMQTIRSRKIYEKLNGQRTTIKR